MPIVLQINGKGITIRITMISDYFNLSYVQVNFTKFTYYLSTNFISSQAKSGASIMLILAIYLISTMLFWLLLYFFHGTRDTN